MLRHCYVDVAVYYYLRYTARATRVTFTPMPADAAAGCLYMLRDARDG